MKTASTAGQAPGGAQRPPAAGVGGTPGIDLRGPAVDGVRDVLDPRTR